MVSPNKSIYNSSLEAKRRDVIEIILIELGQRWSQASLMIFLKVFQ